VCVGQSPFGVSRSRLSGRAVRGNSTLTSRELKVPQQQSE